jgi:hypothetical protein
MKMSSFQEYFDTLEEAKECAKKNVPRYHCLYIIRSYKGGFERGSMNPTYQYFVESEEPFLRVWEKLLFRYEEKLTGNLKIKEYK